MKFAIYTLGCKVNRYEENYIKLNMIKKGYKLVDFKEIADVYIINSCCVTNLSSRKSRNALMRAKKTNDKAITVLCGCYAHEIDINKDDVSADIIIGNNEKKDIVDIISNYKDKVYKVNDISKVKEYELNDKLDLKFDIRENIKIEDGCNNFCSYCIIPYTRGRIRSRNLEDIIEEIKLLVKSGVKEVVLVGIEIVSYGLDLESISLIDVIEKINDIKGLERIRLGSLKPTFLTCENVIRLSKVSKLCNYYHLSVQSLNSDVLNRMNRKYTKEAVLDAVHYLRKYIKDVNITCDMIVGYIDETNEEFEDTYNTCKGIQFFDMNVFKFSKRKGTKAYNLKTIVTGNDKKDRSNRLIKLNEDIKSDILTSMISKKYKVLFEEYKEGYLYGYTTNYIKVKVKGDKSLCLKEIEVEFLGIDQGILVGKIF